MSKAAEEEVGNSSNQEYCNRLVELVFPDSVSIEGTSYNQPKLREALLKPDGDPLRDRLLGLCFIQDEDPDNRTPEHKEFLTEKILDNIFPTDFSFGSISYTKDQLADALPDSPKLQQSVASSRYFMPSKWLLEKESLARNGKPHEGDIYQAVAKEKLIGLCFSGGGIRSATFNLGILQGLAQLGVLPHIDYLSSVSGGGYIHEFLAGWIMRNGDQKSVIRELIPQAQPGCLPRAPEPIQWLKRYASYLTPSRGIFGTDMWTLLAIWFRNTVMNQIPLLATFAAALFLIHLLYLEPIDQPARQVTPILQFTIGDGLWWITGIPILLAAVWSLFILCRNLLRQEERTGGPVHHQCKELLSNGDVVLHIILPWLACAVWSSYWVKFHLGVLSLPLAVPVLIGWVLIFALALIVVYPGGALDAYESYHPGKSTTVAACLYGLAALTSTAVACGLGWGFVWASGTFSEWITCYIGPFGATAATCCSPGASAVFICAWRIQLTILPGLLLSLPYVAIELTLGLLGRDYRDMQREWLARLRAWSVLYALLWAGVVSLTLLGPYLGYWLRHQGTTLKWSAAIGFLASHLTTIFAGKSAKGDGNPTDKGFLGYKPADLAAMIAAPFACVSFVLLLAFAASKAVDALADWYASSPQHPGTDQFAFLIADLACFFAALIIAVIMGRRVDINEFSMHTFYKNRLSRCYLGAVRPGRRSPDPFTGFDSSTEIKFKDKIHNMPPFLTELLPKKYTRYPVASGKVPEKGVYDGPFPIFCTTLNLTTGDDLATQERKGTSFAFTPLYSGYSVGWTDGAENQKVTFNGYVPTDSYAYPKAKNAKYGGIHVDSAVTISGAAASPNMGYNTNPALAFLMTLFNVRLGWWISNPRRIDKWEAKHSRATPRFALWHLLKELFGAVGDDAAYVNLSDGGHFENMGLYELVRRRCTYILVCDAENDPDMTFGGMGMAITKCRADFGAEIDLDLRPLRIDPETGYSKTHCVVGTIKYPPPWASKPNPDDSQTICECLKDEEGDPYTGTIVYMKSSLVGDEPADLLAYQLKSPTFPQDTTANQWFTESIFEAYRLLGHHVATEAIQPALPHKQTTIGERPDMFSLFDSMYEIWYPRTPETEAHFSEHLTLYEKILTELRQRSELAGLDAALNDPRSDLQLLAAAVPPWVAASPDAAVYATQFANSVLDFIYTIYTNLKLAFPDNRVSPHAQWLICLSRRWCRVSLLQRTWADRKAAFPKDFCVFAHRELNLP